jgi:hypothetical protein
MPSTITSLTAPTLPDPVSASETASCGVPSEVRRLSHKSTCADDLYAGNNSALGAIKKPGRPHITRWWTHVESLPVPKKAIESFNDARKEMEKSKKQKRTETVEVVLPNAVVGKVVVRFGASASRSFLSVRS